jgi:hypothetical protein
MHRSLPWSCSGLTRSTCASSGVSSGPCSAWPIANMHRWGAKSDMMHDYAQLTHTSPYKSFTNLPLVSLVF